ncbi:MAG: leucyl aminopeptidase [Lachnospiraceae bacterium]|nr:leucyl aminopeptidase [Lachnospiraceae bacterium]
MEFLETDVCERIELSLERIEEIKEEDFTLAKSNPMFSNIKDYFDKVSDFILYVYDVMNIKNNQDLSLDILENINLKLYEDILGDNYDISYGNPDYAVSSLGEEYGAILSFLYTEIRSIISYAYEGKKLLVAATMELFLEIYNMFSSGEKPNIKYIKEAIYYHMYDYADVLVADRILETISPEYTFATDIIMNSDLEDLRYLYSYGEYIGDNEIRTAKFLNKLPESEVKAMAATYVNGFIKGFETMRIDLKPKKTVNIRYSIGQERMVKYAIDMFRSNGLEPIIFRYPVSRINRKLTIRTGYVATPANKQYEYDHRMDEAIFYDRAFMERKLEVIADTYEKNKELAITYAGPAVIETFGENPFNPIIKESTIKLSDKQQKMSVEYTGKSAEITNKYIPRDKYSFTIIAYPIPEIGDNFEEIFAEIVKVNTLDNELYKSIQQSIIDELDKATYVHVVGKAHNKTDIKVVLHHINQDKETNFENCLADVNIPVGEVFTSPVLTGTDGVLNVSHVYLNELKYTDLFIEFENGKIKSYSCKNFDDEDKNKAFIKENLMFNHETLPIGEFAIGTNTTAYVMAHKYDILYKLPILIVEKMGPHFAVGDTCYSYSEDSRLYNPDGKEIVAKDNECSLLRKSENQEEKSKAYFNCHTDITIPYEEIGGIYSVHSDGTKVAIIENGRFVLSGTEKLNEPFTS